MQNVIPRCQIIVLVENYYQISKASTLYLFTDGPTGQPTEYPPNSDG